MRECILGGAPDRYVNQYEALKLLFSPSPSPSERPRKGGEPKVNAWGITYVYPETAPASFPLHTPEKTVVKDIVRWREYVRAPDLKTIPEAQWDMAKARYDAVDGTLAYKAAFVAPGLFEQCHNLCGLENALVYFLEYPEEMHGLIEYLTEYELQLAEMICSRLRPDAVFHHDDWGSETNSFLRPELFAEMFLEPYKRIYRYYREHGCEFVFHHSDSYAANLVPYMIEMGIDVWQGCMHSNDVPALVKKYNGKITFMGEIDNKQVDFEGWTPEDCERAALNAIKSVDSLTSFIPCITQGGPGSLYTGTYQCLWDAIDKYNRDTYGFTQEEIENARLPISIMF